jgi:cell wall-associated NlpC family hydrolase
MPPRVAEIQNRFAPSTVRSSSASGGSAINTASFNSVLTNLLGSTATDTGSGDTDGSIDLSSLTSVLSTLGRTSSSSAPGSASSTTSGPTGADAVDAAKQYLGVDYVWGGTDPTKGLDCSGLVQRAYKDIGIDLPRVSYDQAKMGTKVDSIDQAKPGDLVAFGSPVDHIAIYAGNGKIVQAPHTGDVVKISDIKRPIAAIRRIIPERGTPDATATATATLTGAAAAGTTTGIPGAAPYEQLFQAAGAKYGLNPRLLAAVAKTESNFDPNARSGVGAVGLMQFMPATAKGMGIDPTDPAQAIDGAAKYLRTQIDRFGSVDLALAAYNAGPGAVQRAGGIPPYAETRNYVTKILGLLGNQSPTSTSGSSISTTNLSTSSLNGVLS